MKIKSSNVHKLHDYIHAMQDLVERYFYGTSMNFSETFAFGNHIVTEPSMMLMTLFDCDKEGKDRIDWESFIEYHAIRFPFIEKVPYKTLKQFAYEVRQIAEGYFSDEPQTIDEYIADLED